MQNFKKDENTISVLLKPNLQKIILHKNVITLLNSSESSIFKLEISVSYEK